MWLAHSRSESSSSPAGKWLSGPVDSRLYCRAQLRFETAALIAPRVEVELTCLVHSRSLVCVASYKPLRCLPTRERPLQNSMGQSDDSCRKRIWHAATPLQGSDQLIQAVLRLRGVGEWIELALVAGKGQQYR